MFFSVSVQFLFLSFPFLSFSFFSLLLYFFFYFFFSFYSILLYLYFLSSYLAVWLGAACQFAVPVRGKLHRLVHVVLVLLWGQHQLHIRVDAAVALIGVAPHNLLTVHAGRGGAGLAHRAGQGELQLTADTQPISQ